MHARWVWLCVVCTAPTGCSVGRDKLCQGVHDAFGVGHGGQLRHDLQGVTFPETGFEVLGSAEAFEPAADLRGGDGAFERVCDAKVRFYLRVSEHAYVCGSNRGGEEGEEGEEG